MASAIAPGSHGPLQPLCVAPFVSISAPQRLCPLQLLSLCHTCLQYQSDATRSRGEVLKERLQEVRAAFQRSEGDMGSSEVQGALPVLAAAVCAAVERTISACQLGSQTIAPAKSSGIGVVAVCHGNSAS